MTARKSCLLDTGENPLVIVTACIMLVQAQARSIQSQRMKLDTRSTPSCGAIGNFDLEEGKIVFSKSVAYSYVNHIPVKDHMCMNI